MTAALTTKVHPIDQLINARKSVRAFLPDPVPPALVDEVLTLAARAPSGNNIQPWRVHVVTGTTLALLKQAVCAAFDDPQGDYQSEYDYYPNEFFEPYKSRRRNLGVDMYSMLNIAKGDRKGMHAQHRRNFTFFDAPVGLIFTIDRRLAQGSWLDYGMFLQTLMLAAEARGLATCAQGAWIDYHSVIGRVLQLPQHEQLVCGLALGYEDESAAINYLRSERAPLSEFVEYHG